MVRAWRAMVEWASLSWALHSASSARRWAKRLCGCGRGHAASKCGTKEQERARIVESFDVFGLGERERGEIAGQRQRPRTFG